MSLTERFFTDYFYLLDSFDDQVSYNLNIVDKLITRKAPRNTTPEGPTLTDNIGKLTNNKLSSPVTIEDKIIFKRPNTLTNTVNLNDYCLPSKDYAMESSSYHINRYTSELQFNDSLSVTFSPYYQLLDYILWPTPTSIEIESEEISGTLPGLTMDTGFLQLLGRESRVITIEGYIVDRNHYSPPSNASIMTVEEQKDKLKTLAKKRESFILYLKGESSVDVVIDSLTLSRERGESSGYQYTIKLVEVN